MSSQIRIEPSKDSRFEAPDGTWCTLWGYVFEDERARAVYYVRYNDTRFEQAEVVVSVGEWGEGSTPEKRDCLAALARKYEGRLAFMLIDAADSSFADQAFLGSMRAAADVRGTDLARRAFAILDEVLVQDERVANLRLRLEA